MVICLPEVYKIVEALCPATDAAGRTGDWVSLKNYKTCFIVCNITQGDPATVAITIQQAKAVAGTSAKAITVPVPIWSNLDCATSDTLVQQTAAVSYTTDAGVAIKQVIFQVDSSTLDIANGFDCVAVLTGASDAANITSAQYFLAGGRYLQATPPAAITD